MPPSCIHYAEMVKDCPAWRPGRYMDPVGCLSCRELAAQTLASEFEFDLATALNHSVLQYAAEIDGDLESGHDLRRLTVLFCQLHSPSYSDYRRGTTLDHLWVADDTDTFVCSHVHQEAA